VIYLVCRKVVDQCETASSCLCGARKLANELPTWNGLCSPPRVSTAPLCASAPVKNIQAALERARPREIQSQVVDIKARKEALDVNLREIGF
jgi:hypothetical protein